METLLGPLIALMVFGVIYALLRRRDGGAMQSAWITAIIALAVLAVVIGLTR